MDGAYVRKPSSIWEIHKYDVYKCKNVFTSVIVPPIGQFAPNLAQEPLDDFRNNQLKFDVESIYFDRHMKQYVFFS